jgi:hypothetical protein
MSCLRAILSNYQTQDGTQDGTDGTVQILRNKSTDQSLRYQQTTYLTLQTQKHVTKKYGKLREKMTKHM